MVNPAPFPISNVPFPAVDASRPVPPCAVPNCGVVAMTPDALLVTTPAVVNGEMVTLPFATVSPLDAVSNP